MAEVPNLKYSFGEDGIIRLQKDLNYMFQHLDHKNVKRLHTEYCDIRSKDGETIIDGPLLTMRAEDSTTIRLKMGWEEATSDFLFTLYGESGDPTIELDSTGDAVFKGSLQSAKDAYIGEHLYIGSSVAPLLVTTNTRGIFVMQPGTTKYLGHIYSTYTTNNIWEFEMESSATLNLTGLHLCRMFSYSGYDGVSTATINSSDYLEIYAWNNRLFVNAKHSSWSDDEGTFLGDDDENVYLGSYNLYYQRVQTAWMMEWDIEYDLHYFWARNQKFITTPTSNWTNIASGVGSGSTFVMTSTRGVYIYNSTSNAAWAEIQSTFASLDLTAFEDGSAATTDDMIVFVVWLEENSTSLFRDGNNSTNGLLIRIGSDSGNSYNFRHGSLNGYTLDAGWHTIVRKIGSYNSYTGAPAFNNIAWSRVGFNSAANKANKGVFVDYIGIHRVSPSASTDFNDFQMEINSTWEKNYTIVADNFLLKKHDDKPVICTLPFKSRSNYGLWFKNVTSFCARLEGESNYYNNAATLSWWRSSNENIALNASSGVLHLSATLGGTTYGGTANLEAFDAGTAYIMQLRRNLGGRLQGLFTEENNLQNTRVVEVYTSTQENEVGGLYIGDGIFNGSQKIKKLEVKPYNDTEVYTGG